MDTKHLTNYWCCVYSLCTLSNEMSYIRNVDNIHKGVFPLPIRKAKKNIESVENSKFGMGHLKRDED